MGLGSILQSKKIWYEFEVAGFTDSQPNLEFHRIEGNGILVVRQTLLQRFCRIRCRCSHETIDLHGERLCRTGSEKQWHEWFERSIVRFRDRDASLLRQHAKQIKAFPGARGGEQRNLYIDASRTLEIDFNQVRAARSEDPNQFAPISAASHFLGEH